MRLGSSRDSWMIWNSWRAQPGSGLHNWKEMKLARTESLDGLRGTRSRWDKFGLQKSLPGMLGNDLKQAWVTAETLGHGREDMSRR